MAVQEAWDVTRGIGAGYVCLHAACCMGMVMYRSFTCCNSDCVKLLKR